MMAWASALNNWPVLRALKHRNFRLFFCGQGVSLVGTWMQQVAMIWLVYRLTNSPFLLGLTGFCSQVPSFLLAPFAGALTDRWNLHRTIIATQTLSMLQAAILAVLALTGTVAVWHVVLLSVFLGLVNGFDIPARQAFLIQMVERREDLGSAIGLNSSMFNGAQLIGPAIAGFLIAAVGEGFCFLTNAVSYAAVLVALLVMRVTPRAPVEAPQHVLLELRDGVRYAWRSTPIRSILMLVSAVNLAAMPLRVLLPIFTTEIFHRGPDTLGLLTAALGTGALVGAVVGRPQIGARPGPANRLDQRGVRTEPDHVLAVERRLALAGLSDGERFCDDDDDGRQQHDFADDRR